MVNRWDASSAIYAALREAGPIGHPARQTLAARLALRLAEQRHVTEVRFTVAPGTPLEAIRLALVEVTGEAAHDAPGDAISPADGSEAAPDPPHASQSVPEACIGRPRACLACGETFEVNVRHAQTHRFCSASCRSRHRHPPRALQGALGGMAVQGRPHEAGPVQGVDEGPTAEAHCRRDP
jgi:hypothetical protein